MQSSTPGSRTGDGSGTAVYELIDRPDSSGFGSYRGSGLVIPAALEGRPVNYTAMMILNDEPPITAGREIWGFSKRCGEPTLDMRADGLTGMLAHSGEQVAMSTMAYQPERPACGPEVCVRRLAKQMGAHVGRRIARAAAGKPEGPPFRFRGRGAMATIGRNRAIAQMGRLRVRGFPGWVLWGLAHVYFLIGFRNRLAVLMNWTWAYVTWQRGVRLITGAQI
jgi:hypothetical protein